MEQISFIIPAFNEERLLGPCIDSIRSECPLAHEIIVVDNNSTDLTAEIANLHGTKLIHEPIKGVVRARQAGFLAATGDLLVFIDADSELPQGWLAIMLKTMAKPGVVSCSGPLIFHDLSLTKRILTSMFYTVGVVISWFLPMVQGGNFVARRVALELINGFDSSIEFYGEDTMTAIRMANIGTIKFVPGLFLWSSGRRMTAEGFFVIGCRYIANYFWMQITGKAWTANYRDIRL